MLSDEMNGGCVLYPYFVGCIISSYFDHSINKEDIWNRSGEGISEISLIFQNTTKVPDILDLSFHNLTTISKTTFSHLPDIENVKSLYLHHNSLKEIKNDAFLPLKSLKHLDISNCGLRNHSIHEGAFQSLSKLTSLDMQENLFQKSGYPEHAISDLSSLQKLTIDVFDEFTFTKTFEKLLYLQSINLNPQGTFHLSNASFEGLSLSPIKQLSLQFYNHVFCHITEELFCFFPYITSLEMNIGGKCDIKTALRSLKCLRNRNMEVINLANTFKSFEGPPVILDAWAMEYLFNICAKKLILSNSAMIYISSMLARTTLMKCIEYIDVSSNSIQQVSLSEALTFFFFAPKLKTILACCNSPSDEHIHLKNTSLTAFQPFLHTWKINVTFSDTLEFIDFHDNNIHDVVGGMKISVTARGLKELSIANANLNMSFLDFDGMPLLEKLDISFTKCENISINLLRRLDHLISLKAVNVGLNSVLKRDPFGVLFRNLTKLENIDISKNNIKNIVDYLFHYQKFSLQVLVIEDNSLTHFPPFLERLQGLRYLNIRKNKLAVLNDNDDKILRSLNKIQIYMKNNPFTCMCSSRTSLRILKRHKNKFVDLNEIKCIDSDLNLHYMLQEENWKWFEVRCDSTIWLAFSSAFFVMSVGIIFAMVLIKRYKLHLDYLIFRLRRRLRGVQYQKLDSSYEYDVFISYAPEDLSWVTCVLHKQLETYELRVCFHDKNFFPGESVAEEIVKYIDKSRKVLFLITKDFLKSCWASYEVQMAVVHAFHNDRQSMIVLLMKDNIPIIEMPDDLKNVWWTLNYLHLPDKDSKNEIDVFWDKLVNLLK